MGISEFITLNALMFRTTEGVCKAQAPMHFNDNSPYRACPGAYLRYVHPLRTAVKAGEVPGDIHFFLGLGLLQQVVNGDEGSTAIHVVTGEPHESILARTAQRDSVDSNISWTIQGYLYIVSIIPMCVYIYTFYFVHLCYLLSRIFVELYRTGESLVLDN